MEPGFDPAWAPDGRSVGYVRARYTTRGSWLHLESDDAGPTAWDQIRVFNLATREAVNVDFTNLRHGNGFEQCLLWLDAERIVFLASGMKHLRPDSAGRERDWSDLTEYRRIGADGVVVGHLVSKHGRFLVPPGRHLQVERLRNGAIALWDHPAGRGSQELEITVRIVDLSGRLLETKRIPAGRWGSATGAVGTVIPQYPVMLEPDVRHDRDRLLVLKGARVEVLHTSRGAITGIYGSPDGERVAYVERAGPRGIGYRIMVLPVAGGQPKLVTTGVYDLSRIAWSPDGKYIAYPRASDGLITIADVPAIE